MYFWKCLQLFFTLKENDLKIISSFQFANYALYLKYTKYCGIGRGLRLAMNLFFHIQYHLLNFSIDFLFKTGKTREMFT